MKEHIKLKKNVIKKFIGFGILVFTIIIAVIAILKIKELDILPDKYFYLIIGGEVLLTIISGLLLLKTKRLFGLY